MLERGRSDTVQSESACSNEADPDLKTGVSHMLERGRCINTIPIGDAEPDPDPKTTSVHATGVESADIDELLSEIELENRRANLQAVWPNEKPDLSELHSLIADASRWHSHV